MIGGDLVEAAEELELDRFVLDDGLDHHVTIVERVHTGGVAEEASGGVAILGTQAFAGDGLVHRSVDAPLRRRGVGAQGPQGDAAAPAPDRDRFDGVDERGLVAPELRAEAERHRNAHRHPSGNTHIAPAKAEQHRVDDALNATRAAVESGIVPGGGTALLLATRAVEKLTDDNADIQAGINIVRKALESPVRQIAENAGVEGSIVVGKILESKTNHGFDAQNEVYCDLIAAGIVDPTKVVSTALRDAASVAGLLITTEAMVADKPEPKGAAAPAMPDMGGMGGMGGMM